MIVAIRILLVCCVFELGKCQDLLLNQFGSYQHEGETTVCRIPMQDIVATAQTTASRVLQGICNPRELNDRFINLESQMVEQFNVLKTMILNVEDKLRDQDEKVRAQHRKLQRILSSPARLQKKFAGDKKVISLPKVGKTNKTSKLQQEKPSEENIVYDYYVVPIIIDDLTNEQAASPREVEISRYNSTIHLENRRRVFTYYWTIRDLPYRMKNWSWRRSLRSKSFYIFQNGYKMYMKIFPNQNGKNIYIHVGITRGENDEKLNWPFKLKHKIQMVDHNYPAYDLRSRIWDPTELCSEWNWEKPNSTRDNYECVGLGFPKETLFQRKYLINDAITMKFTVFLDE